MAIATTPPENSSNNQESDDLQEDHGGGVVSPPPPVCQCCGRLYGPGSAQSCNHPGCGHLFCLRCEEGTGYCPCRHDDTASSATRPIISESGVNSATVSWSTLVSLMIVTWLLFNVITPGKDPMDSSERPPSCFDSLF